MSSVLHLTTDQYDRMVVAGAFDRLDKRIELLHGVIREMNPAGPLHSDLVVFLTQWSFKNIDTSKISVRVQTGIHLPEFDSRPEPDVSWVKAKRYRDAHPGASDVVLLIEVADSSLETDTGEKAKLYAAAGIPEYWVVNAFDRLVHVYREPSASGYLSLSTAKIVDSIAPANHPQAVLSLAELFGV